MVIASEEASAITKTNHWQIEDHISLKLRLLINAMRINWYELVGQRRLKLLVVVDLVNGVYFVKEVRLSFSCKHIMTFVLFFHVWPYRLNK